MERPVASAGRWSWLWFFPLLGLLAWHAGMTLQLFGVDDPWQRLVDDQVVVSGRHPLHLYHGYLGARSFWPTHHFSCYDPNFDAGYPKTPIFDSGCRPAEIFLTIAGGRYDPAAYKIGLAICCLVAPFLLLVACWGTGLSAAATTLALVAGLMVWWGTPGSNSLELGDIDLMLATLAVLAHVGLLIRFDREPSFLAWQGLFITACLGWFIHPIIFPVLLPLLLVYYVSVGPRHSLSTWHLALAVSEIGAVVVNGYWLADWVHHWWLRSPLPASDAMLVHRNLQTIWLAPQWGDDADRTLLAVLLISALIGIVLLNQMQQRVSARLLGLGTGGLWLLAVLGVSFEPLARLGTSDLLAPALWFAVVPASYAWIQMFRFVAWATGSPFRGVVVSAALLGGATLLKRDVLEPWAQRCTQPSRLTIGLTPERQDLVQALRELTTSEARILWEDHRPRGIESRWTALLPLLTDRFFVGGLDAYGAIEHAKIGLVDQVLRDRPLSHWTDDELLDYCRHYNIGWVACRSPQSASRFRAWKATEEIAQLNDESTIYLFAVRRSTYSFALKGQATLLRADSRSLTLTDVIPNENGIVVLSFHYQTGIEATPQRVAVEPEPDAGDLIPFIRLRVQRPVPRLTLTWPGW